MDKEVVFYETTEDFYALLEPEQNAFGQLKNKVLRELHVERLEIVL